MSRSRITISVNQEIVKEIDRRIDGMHIRNRSHAIETLLAEVLNLSTVKTAVVLAGGQDALKKIPAIEHSLSRLQKFGISRVIVAVGYLGPEIENQLSGHHRPGMKLEFHRSSNGTGGALYELKRKLTKPFFVVNISTPMDINLGGLVRFHQQHQPVATVASPGRRHSTGYYLLEPTIFDYIKKGFSSLEEEVFATLISAGKLVSFPMAAE